jgi:hypothetical protein
VRPQGSQLPGEGLGASAGREPLPPVAARSPLEVCFRDCLGLGQADWIQGHFVRHAAPESSFLTRFEVETMLCIHMPAAMRAVEAVFGK